ncbi:hypothetical protein [Fulvivirga imtechensis]|uniref:hypothetical protein n=1 Tax=Fulvivirga imtechensis TaxID=881893 RepID=UPI0012FB6033|nr:hypothetical protein [Fulvivirga imtechensis]
MKNKLFSIMLIGMLSLPLIGTYSWLRYQKHMVRREVKQRIIRGIDPSELVRLTFTIEESKTALYWEHSGEFEYNGQMYDVVDADTVGNTVTFLCWWDHAETELNIKLDELTRIALDSNKDHQQQKKNLIENIELKYLRSQFTSKLSATFIVVEYHMHYNWSYFSISLQPSIPPPRSA